MLFIVCLLFCNGNALLLPLEKDFWLHFFKYGQVVSRGAVLTHVRTYIHTLVLGTVVCYFAVRDVLLWRKGVRMPSGCVLQFF